MRTLRNMQEQFWKKFLSTDTQYLLPALGIVPKYLINERVVMLTKIQTPIPHPVLNESYVLGIQLDKELVYSKHV
jgi:hypothetical protein